MGLFDRLTCQDPRFVCSEGHHLGAEEFQTKDLGCTMGHATIDVADLFVFEPAMWGEPEVGTMIAIYADCTQCPAFVQAGTGNLCAAWVEFAVELAEIGRKGDHYTARVNHVRRTSEPTAEWLRTEPAKPWMKGCLGPMSWDQAQSAHMDHYVRSRVVVADPAELIATIARECLAAMTPDEITHMRHEQRISFAGGNVALSWRPSDGELGSTLKTALDLVRRQAGECPCGKCAAARSEAK